MSLISQIIELFFGHKYYVNIVVNKGTLNGEATSYVHRTRRDAEEHRRKIESTTTFQYSETITFRSKKYEY